MPKSHLYLSTAQAGERLDISREHVRRLIQRGELRAEETVNGFILDAFEVDRYAIHRRVLQDQRQFRAAVDELATQARRVDEATGIQSAVVQMRDQMKLHPAFEVPAAVAPQLQWIEQEVAAQKALASLAGPTETIMEQWRCYDEDARRVMGHAVSGVSASQKMVQSMEVNEQKPFAKGWPADVNISAADVERPDEHFANSIAYARKDSEGPQKSDSSTTIESFVSPAVRNEEMARGFVVPETREGRLEEKVDELNRKVEQLTKLVMQQHADTTTMELPTWQEWAGSDRPEDVLAKLDAIRAETTGGKQAGENSTDVIRAAREARGQDG